MPKEEIRHIRFRGDDNWLLSITTPFKYLINIECLKGVAITQSPKKGGK